MAQFVIRDAHGRAVGDSYRTPLAAIRRARTLAHTLGIEMTVIERADDAADGGHPVAYIATSGDLDACRRPILFASDGAPLLTLHEPAMKPYPPMLRRYLVTLTPAIRLHGGGYRAVITPNVADKTYEIEARTLADLEAQIRQMVQASRQSSTPIIRLANPRERKPIGFHRWVQQMALLFIEYAPEQQTISTC